MSIIVVIIIIIIIIVANGRFRQVIKMDMRIEEIVGLESIVGVAQLAGARHACEAAGARAIELEHGADRVVRIVVAEVEYASRGMAA